MSDKKKALNDAADKVSMIVNKHDEYFPDADSLDFDPDAKVVSVAPLPAINESEDEDESEDEEKSEEEDKSEDEDKSGDEDEEDAIEEQERSEIEVEHEEWFQMKIRYDKFLKAAHWTSQTDTVRTMSDLVDKNGVYLCLGGAFITPGEFYVNPLQFWNSLEGMMERMQKQYEIMAKAKENLGVPWEGHLSPGFLVAARSHKNMEYHRSVNLGLVNDDEYMVQFLDYGDIVLAPIKEMRYLPLKFLNTMEFQAIRCTLQHNVDGTQPWTMDEGEYFRKLVSGKTLAIRFKQNFKLERGSVWEVDVHFYNERLQKITTFHVGRQVFRESGRDIVKQEDEEDTTDPKVVITQFSKGSL